MFNSTKTNKIIGWSIWLVAMLVYLISLAPSAGFWDSSEWIAVGYKLQVGHPPGAPFYVLLARLFTLIFAFGSGSYAAFAVNLLSAFASAFTILFLYFTIVMLLQRITVKNTPEFSRVQQIMIWGSSAVGALAYAFSDSFWQSATEAEVYSLSSLLTAAVFWCMLKWEKISEKPGAERWLFLITYLMGLSIGTHLLNLLTIPALVFVFGFKKYKPNLKNILLLAGFAIALLFAILYLLIPGVSNAVAYTDVLFVNVFHLPIGSGMITGFLILYAIFAVSIFIAIRKKLQRLRIILTMVLLLLTGYSSYALTVLRSSAGTPINEADPSQAYNLLSYLEREQYGDRPLLKGPFFNSVLNPQKPYIEASPLHRIVNGKYVITGYQMQPNYIKQDTRYFPRMWSSKENHTEAYKEWSGNNGDKIPSMKENLRFLFRYQIGHMYFRYFMWNFVGRQNDIQGHGGPVNGNWISGIGFIDRLRLGETSVDSNSILKNPAKNTYFFIPLLVGLIGLVFHFRKDKKASGILLLLFFFTGIAIVIYLNQFPYQPRERDYSYAGSFYTFSVWIGIGCYALFYLLKKKWQTLRVAIITTSVCLLAVPVLMLAENFADHNKSGQRLASEMAYNYLSGLAPNAILFTNGDNDTYPLWYLQEVEGVRTDVRVINLSYLNSDWYINQCRKKQYESDPVPCNIDASAYLAGTREFVYIHDNVFPFVDKIYESHKAEFDHSMEQIYAQWVGMLDKSLYPQMKPDEYEKLKKDFMFMAPHGKNPQFKAFRSFIENISSPEKAKLYKIDLTIANAILLAIDNMLKAQIEKPIPLADALAFVFSDNESNKMQHSYSDKPENYFPGTRLIMPLNKEHLLSTGTVKASQKEWIPDAMEWEIPKKLLTKSDLIVLEIINENNWKRPVYFSITAGSESYLGLEKYFSLEGMSFRLAPIINELSQKSIGSVDAEMIYKNLTENFRLYSYTDSSVYLDDNMRQLAGNIRNIYGHCARALYFEGRIKESESMLDACLELIPNNRVAYEYYTTTLIHGYYRINKKKKARETAQILAANSVEYLSFLLSFDEKYQPSLDKEEKKTLLILQQLNRMAKEYKHREYLPEIESQYRNMRTAYEKKKGKSFEN
ncbi:MAG: DUF2723 domain-containing protein [Bacteroidales bacterium]|nr:DUF2723 domain-containing protein [Bacteroidales bacterium]HOY38489.1 DUF2723 domain-containing protein [Bacteroidales bacterium]